MRIARGDLHDLYVEDDRAAVMVDTEVVVLSELATTILLSLPEAGEATLDEVTAAVVDTHGEPESPHEAATLVLHNVEDLARHRILVTEDPR